MPLLSHALPERGKRDRFDGMADESDAGDASINVMPNIGTDSPKLTILSRTSL
jgi:hypothetical protein